ncbi:MAG: PH domain-containing protein [Melioribacteraceae bacterium]|nr:PH domain-containing protein [Melioribacteraceae bacterium]MCF8356953.1 PH domain-containing protein [Melioribacteraceae bacterium]MCF8395638.1 PH domain-containing protein [Melioribacteraceae bacterium]MCF8420645.1 PH domain-containing protein [Melioribacteraceae bacterium]
MLWIEFGTYYIISGNNLIIRSGPMKYTIEIDSITSITRKTDVLASPALSIKRLLIKHKKSYTGIYISPLDEDKFIESINPDFRLENSSSGQTIIK